MLLCAEGEMMKSDELLSKINKFCAENGLGVPSISMSPVKVSKTTIDYTVDVRFKLISEMRRCEYETKCTK